jgi:hypothetical protein
VGLTKIGGDVLDWIYMDGDKDHRLALVNKVMNLGVP